MKMHLVTGGLGFIGSHIAETLVSRGDRVRILDLATARRENIGAIENQVEVLRGDLTDPLALRAALAGVDTVFHEAALASVPRSLEAPLATHAACATGTLMLLDEARRQGVRRIIYAASSSAYGNPPVQGAKKETDLPQPLSPYAAAKLSGEYYCRAFYESFGLETVCLRYFNVFGPRQDPNGPYAAVIPRFITAMLAGEQPLIYGDGRQSRDFTYIANVVQANLLAAEAPGAPGRVINVGSGTSTSLLDLVHRLNQELGAQIVPRHEPPRVGDVRDSLADISQAREVLGFVPQVDLAAGLARTVASFVQARPATGA
jgi:UDP-glucose 4-epimerase